MSKSFSVNIAEYVWKKNGTLEQVARVVFLKLFSGVISDTIVDTGRLMGNWQTTAGYPASGTLERYAAGGSKGNFRAENEPLGKIKGLDVYYLTNNLPYAEKLERRDGMIVKNAARIGRNIREAINESQN